MEMKICSLRKGLGSEIADFVLGCCCFGFCWWGLHFSWLPLHSVKIVRFSYFSTAISIAAEEAVAVCYTLAVQLRMHRAPQSRERFLSFFSGVNLDMVPK